MTSLHDNNLIIRRTIWLKGQTIDKLTMIKLIYCLTFQPYIGFAFCCHECSVNDLESTWCDTHTTYFHCS